MNVKIETIKLVFGKKEVELSIEEARKLKSQLDSLFGSNEYVNHPLFVRQYITQYVPYVPYTPYIGPACGQMVGSLQQCQSNDSIGLIALGGQ